MNGKAQLNESPEGTFKTSSHLGVLEREPDDTVVDSDTIIKEKFNVFLALYRVIVQLNIENGRFFKR